MMFSRVRSRVTGCVIVLLTGGAMAQTTSSLGGVVMDAATEAPLPGAAVQVLVADTTYGAVTDSLGRFRADRIPTGIHRVRVSYLGYAAEEIGELWIRSGKEEMISVYLVRSAKELGEVEVRGVVPARLDPMSYHMLTVEQSLRFPATFFDPARLALSYSGVASTNDQANHFSVRGNGPASNAWLLEGAEIVNPNHLTNAGTASDLPTLSGGGTTILSAQMLGTSRLLMGGFSAPYGNALGGIMDLRLRPGTDARRAFTGQAGLLGIDLSTEDPFKQGGRATYLVNYRYSTLGLLSAMGVELGDEEITFQDLSFNVYLPIGRSSLTVFGMGGTSSNHFAAKDSTEWEFDKDDRTIDYSASVGAAGLTLKVPLGAGMAWNTTVVLSANDQERVEEVPEIRRFPAYTVQNTLYEQKASIVSTLKGVLGSRFSYGIGGTAMHRLMDKQLTLHDRVDTWLLRPYAQGSYAITEMLRAELGLGYSYYHYNGSSVVEPRASLQWTVREGRTVTVSAGQRGQLPQIQSFTLGPEGSYLNNRQLGIMRSRDLELSYQHALATHLHLRVGAYLQELSDIPVGEFGIFGSASYAELSVVNAWDDEYFWQMSDRGTAMNRGLELSLDHRFHRGLFYQVNGTLLEASYTDREGATHDSRWDVGAIGNLVVGREWEKEREGLKRTWGLSARMNVSGGQRYTADVAQPYGAQNATYQRLDLRVYLKRERKGRTGMWSLDLLNATNVQNEAYRYFDLRKGEVVTKYQLGLIPNLSYRIEF